MQIILKPVKSSIKVFNYLEKKGLISVLKPTNKAIKTKTRTGIVDILYTSNKKFGSHRLMCIGKRTKNVDYQKLYLVFALDKIDVFSKKLSKNLLNEKDFIAVEVVYNDPHLSFFTVLKKTVHCEVVKDEDKQHPVFFVTESSDLKNNKIKHKDLTVEVGD